MIPLEIVRRIEVLLSEGVSQREIARRLHVGRNQVREIDQGTRAAYPVPEVENAIRPLEKPRRCPQCGVLVFPPCVYCQLTRRGGPPSAREWNDVILPGLYIELELKCEHYRRYVEIRKRRQCQQAHDRPSPWDDDEARRTG